MKRYGVFIRFLWLCLLLWLGVMTLREAPREARPSAAENRMLAAAPRLSKGAVLTGDFMSGAESWLADGVVLRDRWIEGAQRVERALALPVDAETEAARMMAAIQAETGEAEPTATAARSPAATEAPPSPLPAAEATLTPTASPQSTARPEATPSGGQEASFWIQYTDGRTKTIATYPEKNIRRAAEVLNEYRSLLPADGRVLYAVMPLAALGNAYIDEADRRAGWTSEAEDRLQALVDEGVYILNGAAVIEPALRRGEYVYFRTDHHWTARGAWHLYAAAMARLGLPSLGYDEYAYTVNRGMGGGGPRSDTIEIPHPLQPVRSYLLEKLRQNEEISYMFYDRADYPAYVGGTRTPWRQFVSGFHTGRTALIIGDSYQNAFVHYLLPHYDQVLMTDLRGMYYREEQAGAGVQKYIETFGVDDVYFIFCSSTDVNSDFFINGQVTRYLYR